MGGCTNCGSKTGCDHRKGDMMAAIDVALGTLYPARVWQPPAASTDPAALAADAAALAEELADVLRAATLVRLPDADAPCAFVYVLCVGRAPCAIAVRDAGVAIPDEWWTAPGPIHERYLRVALAAAAPFAIVQEVAVEVHPDGDGVLVREQLQSGVFSPSLLARMQKLVATLPAYGRRHLDLGDLIGPPPGFASGTWSRDFIGTPGIVNYLFFAQPATLTTTTWLPREAV